MFILELAIGQRLRKGSIGVWKQVKNGFACEAIFKKKCCPLNYSLTKVSDFILQSQPNYPKIHTMKSHINFVDWVLQSLS